MLTTRNARYASICLWTVAYSLAAVAADGDLDPAFGSSGVARLSQPYPGNWVPTDLAVQSDGKVVVVGNVDTTACFVLRLNTDGSLDTTFAGLNGKGTPGYFIAAGCALNSVAVRGNDRIVAAGAETPYGTSVQSGLIFQFTHDGNPDSSFPIDSLFSQLTPAKGDLGLVLNRLRLDASGNAVFAGSYTYQNNNTDFFVGRIDAAGQNLAQTRYQFVGSANHVDVPSDLAIADDGTYYIAGTVTGYTLGNALDCGVVHYAFQSGAFVLDTTFEAGLSPFFTISGDFGNGNNDYCYALSLQSKAGNLILAGSSDIELFATGWQAATAFTQGLDGTAGSRTPLAFYWDHGATAFAAGDVDEVRRVILDPYDQAPLFIGSGPNHSSFPATGYDIGVMRLSAPSTPDVSFATGGFAFYDVGSTVIPLHANQNHANSAVFDRGRLTIAGTAQGSTSGTDVVVIRLAPFNGIFKDGFD